MSEELTQVAQLQAGGVPNEPSQELNTQPAVEDISTEATEGQPDVALDKPITEAGTPAENNNVDTQATLSEHNQQLEQRLKEYELQEAERKAIADRLGVDESQADLLGLYSLEAQIENRANATFIKMCSEYGVDSNPQGMQASLEALKESNPQKYYEFVDNAKNINNNLNRQKNEIAYANYNHGVNKFVQENQQLVQNVPVFADIVDKYCRANIGNPNIYGELTSVAEMAIGLLRSGVEIGQAYSAQQRAKTDTSAVSGGIATSQTPVYTSDKIWSRGEIGKLSTDEFSKYEKQIMQAYAEGRIQD